MKCEEQIRPHWSHDRTTCSFGATHLVYGIPVCSKHAANRAGAVPIDPARLIEALRDIAGGKAATPAQTVAVMQTIARRALGEIR